MSDLKMGEIIAGIREETKKMESSWSSKVLFHAKRPFKWLAWNLWGRRRAIKRMQLLAGLIPDPRATTREELANQFLSPTKIGVIEPFGKSKSSHEQTVKEIESLRTPLPRPDVVDDPEAN